MIELKQINKIYKQKMQFVHCLKDVSLRFNPREFSVIAGPSGSGKTTLLNILGLLDQPSSGRYLFDEAEMTTKSSRELADIRRQHIGFVFQSYNLMPVLTALENTAMVMELNGLKFQEYQPIALRTLESVGLKEMADRFPDQLSGGQQQRVAVARAIASRPKLVIADEPTANLDSKTAISLLDLMQKLNEEQGISFIFSSHDPLVIERAGRIIDLRDGAVVSDKTRLKEAKRSDQERIEQSA